MKLNETQIYKGIGSIKYVNDKYEGKVYFYTHFSSGDTFWDETIEGAKEMLDHSEKRNEEIKAAVRMLQGYGYKVYKEVA